MLINEFVADVLADINALPVEAGEIDSLVSTESYLNFKNLKKLLKQFLTSDIEVSYENLKIFDKFLSARAHEVLKTDASYFHINSRINQACHILSEYLSSVLGVCSYQFLFPSVVAINPQLSRRNLSHFRFHEIILSDDNEPIEVEKCLEIAYEDKTTALYTTGKNKRPLTENEKQRIINHSKEAALYYKTLQQFLDSGAENDLKLASHRFTAVINSDGYKVTATYGGKGRETLGKYVMTLIQTKDELIEVLTTHLSPYNWQSFVAALPTAEIIKMFLNGDPLINILQNQSSYNNDDIHNKAILFCLAEIAKRETQMQYHHMQELKEKYSLLNKVSNAFTFFKEKYPNKAINFIVGPSHLEEELGFIIFQKFLISSYQLNEFDLFLKNEDKNAHADYFDSLFGLLPFFREQIERIPNINYAKKPK